MAGLELRRTVSLYEDLDDNQKEFVNMIISRQSGLLPADLDMRIGKLWEVLDTDKNGELTKEDFVSAIPKIQDELQQIWGWLSNKVDFDNTGRIEQSEFLAYFVVNALTNVEKEDIPAGNVLQQFTYCRANFREALEGIVAEVELQITGPTPSPVGPDDIDG